MTILSEFENIENDPRFMDGGGPGEGTGITLSDDMPISPDMMYQVQNIRGGAGVRPGSLGQKYPLGGIAELQEVLADMPAAADLGSVLTQIQQRPALGIGAGGRQFDPRAQGTTFEDLEAARATGGPPAAGTGGDISNKIIRALEDGGGMPGDIGTEGFGEMSPEQEAAAAHAFGQAASSMFGPNIAGLNNIANIAGAISQGGLQGALSTVLGMALNPIAMAQFVFTFSQAYSQAMDSLAASEEARSQNPQITQEEMASQDPSLAPPEDPFANLEQLGQEIGHHTSPPTISPTIAQPQSLPPISQAEMVGHGGPVGPGVGPGSGGTGPGGTTPGLTEGSQDPVARGAPLGPGDPDTGSGEGEGNSGGGGGEGPGGPGAGPGPPGPPGGCFVAGTKIRTLKGTKSIEDIRPGDMVMCFPDDDTLVLELTPKKVIKIKMHEDHPTININGRILTTVEHRFVTGKGEWKPAGKLEVGKDVLIGANRNQIPVVKVWDGPRKTVYNIEVEDFHTYIANGFRVHNWKHTGSIIKPTPESGLMKGHEVKIRALIGEGVLPINIIDSLGETCFEAIRLGKVSTDKIKKFVKEQMSRPKR